MALQKQLIELRPQGGLQQAASKWLSVPFHTLDNLLYDKFGAVQKRPPIVQLTTATYPTGLLSLVGSIAPLSSPTGELLQVGRQPLAAEKNVGENGPCLYTYSSNAAGWVRKAPVPSLRVRRSSGIRGQTSITDYPPQVCRIGNYECVLYMDTGGAYIRLIDRSTGAVMLDNTVIVNGSAGRPIGKVALINCGDGLFTFVHMNSTGTQFRRTTLNPANLVSTLSNVGVSFGTTITGWDCCPSTTGYFLLAISENPVGTSILRVQNSSGTVTHTVTETVGYAGAISVAFKQLSVPTVAMLWDGGTISYLKVYNAGTLTPITSTEIFITNPFHANIVNSLVVGFDAIGLIHCFGVGKLPTTLYRGTKWKVYYLSDNSWSNGSVAYEIPWNIPQSKPFTLGEDTYILMSRWRDGTPDGSRYGYSLVNLTRNSDKISSTRPLYLEGCFAPLDGMGVTYSANETHTPWINVENDTTVVLPILVRGRGVVGNLGGTTWCDVLELHKAAGYWDPDLWLSAYASKLLHLNGSLPVQFDGQTACEIGFLEPPQHAVGNTPVQTSAGSALEPGTYEYLFTWEWVDSVGNRHESRASDPMLVTVTGGHHAVTFKVTTTALTRRGSQDDGIGNLPKLVAYRSLKNAPDVHYRLPIITQFNNPQAYDLTVVDLSSDSTLLSAGLGQFYGDGGLLENETPPPALHIQSSGGKVWITSAEAPEVWASKDLLEGEPPSFTPFNRITLDDAQTRLIGTSFLDGLLVIFSEARIYTVPAASGPSDAGQGGWPRPEEVQSSGGCVAASSILPYAQGVFYRDVDGFKLLTRGRSIEPIGDAVKDITDEYTTTLNTVLDVARERIYAFVAREDGNQIVIVYDFGHNAWSTLSTVVVNDDDVEIPWTNSRMGMWNGDPTFSYGDAIHTMSPDTVSVPSGYDYLFGQLHRWITSTLATPWVLLNTLGGYQRAWRVALELEKLSDHGLTLNFYNDGGETTPVQTEVWTDAEITALQGLPRERLLVGVAIQKCQSMKLELQDSAPGVESGSNPAGFRYHGLTLEIGVKQNSEKAEKANTR